MPPTHQLHDHILLGRDITTTGWAIRIAIPLAAGLLLILGAVLLWHRQRIWRERTRNGGRDGVQRVYG